MQEHVSFLSFPFFCAYVQPRKNFYDWFIIYFDGYKAIHQNGNVLKVRAKHLVSISDRE